MSDRQRRWRWRTARAKQKTETSPAPISLIVVHALDIITRTLPLHYNIFWNKNVSSDVFLTTVFFPIGWLVCPLRDAGLTTPSTVFIPLILPYTSSSTVRHAMYSDKVEVLRFETEPYRTKNGSPLNKNGVLLYNNNNSNKNHNNPKHFIYQNGYHNTSVLYYVLLANN